jgi:hypothetical protein
MTNSGDGEPERRQSVFSAGARTFGIWASGLVGFAVTGSGLGGIIDHLSGSYSSDGSGGGFLAGLALFTCARLWAGERR